MSSYPRRLTASQLPSVRTLYFLNYRRGMGIAVKGIPDGCIASPCGFRSNGWLTCFFSLDLFYVALPV